MTTQCKHRNTIETSVGHSSGLALLCTDCGGLNTFVPWGPATITPDVEIEIRAAELAALASDYANDVITWETATATTNIGGPRSDAAWLARAIATHEVES